MIVPDPAKSRTYPALLCMPLEQLLASVALCHYHAYVLRGRATRGTKHFRRHAMI
jgi:hypothetical protein